MKPIPFLTEEEIQKLQEAEANSSKEQKEKLLSKLKPSTLLVRISLSQRRLVLGKPLLWQSAFWTNWRVV